MIHLTKIIFAIALLGFFAACDKDQECINFLEGTWTINSTSQYNVTADTAISPGTPQAGSITVSTMQFTPYTLSEAEMGTAVSKSVTTQSSPLPDTSYTYTTNMEYKVLEKCTKFWFKAPGAPDSTAITADITTLNATTFNFEYNVSSPFSSDTYRISSNLSK